MKKILMLLMMVSAILYLSACTENSDEAKPDTSESIPEQVSAEIMVPEKVSLSEETILKVQVLQGEEKVEDADEVKFEVWKGSNKDDSEMIEAEHMKDGIYQVETSFEEDGIYYVQTHVTARDMHVMPIKHIIAGNVSEEELKALEEESGHQHDHDESDHQH
ncbi:FixH family protein [Rossellomorea sp. NS-SX7]|uniref:FixH family protein n=1 Tax=Rossellomorea sp. NS-SX7 TaxID=3463856 RepID=UPI0040587F5D